MIRNSRAGKHREDKALLLVSARLVTVAYLLVATHHRLA